MMNVSIMSILVVVSVSMATPARADESEPAVDLGGTVHATFSWADGGGIKGSVTLRFPEQRLGLGLGGFTNMFVEGPNLGAELDLFTNVLHDNLDLGGYAVVGHYDDYHYVANTYWAAGGMGQLRFWHVSFLAQVGWMSYSDRRDSQYIKFGLGAWF